MKTFEDFYTSLKEDELWFEQASKLHKPETFESVARQVWVDKLAEGQFPPMKEIRRHVFNKVSKVPSDRPKVKWHLKESDKPEEKKIEKPPLVRGSPQYLKRVNELMEAHLSRSQEPFKRIRNMSDKEVDEEGQVDKKKTQEFTPSELEQRIGARKHFELARSSRGRYFLEAYPDASAEEVEAYCDKFIDIDDPLKLFH